MPKRVLKTVKKAPLVELAQTPQPLIAANKIIYEGGATRRQHCLSFTLVPKEAVEGIARRLQCGAVIHGKDNWREGGPAFVEATKNHLINHLLAYIEFGKLDDLDAIGANYAFLEYFHARALK